MEADWISHTETSLLVSLAYSSVSISHPFVSYAPLAARGEGPSFTATVYAIRGVYTRRRFYGNVNG